MKTTSSLPHCSDGELLAMVSAGAGDTVFAEIFSRHSSMVFATAMRICGNEQDAEDVVQSVFLVLLKKSRSLRWHGNIGGWLYRAAVLDARKAQAKSSRYCAQKVDFEKEIRTAGGRRTDEELLPILDEELARLPKKYQSALVLCYLERLSYEEAGKALNLSANAIKRRLDRGKEVLRRRFVSRGVAASVTAISVVLTSEGASRAAHLTSAFSSQIVEAFSRTLATKSAPFSLLHSFAHVPFIYRAGSFAAGVAATIALVSFVSSAAEKETAAAPNSQPVKTRRLAIPTNPPAENVAPESNEPKLTAREKARNIFLMPGEVTFQQKPIEEAFALVEDEFRKVGLDQTGVNLMVAPGYQPSKARITTGLPIGGSLESCIKELADHNGLRYVWKGDALLIGDFPEQEVWGDSPIERAVKDCLHSATPWLDAARDGRTEVARGLVDAGFPLNSINKEDRRLPLESAAFEGRTAMVRLLLKQGADPNGRRASHIVGEGSVLSAAVSGGYGDVVEVLLNAGADIHYGGRTQSPLQIAVERGHTTIARLLIARGAKATPADLLALQKADQALLARDFSKQNLSNLSSQQLLDGLIQSVDSSPQKALDFDSARAVLTALQKRGGETERKIAAYLKTGEDVRLRPIGGSARIRSDDGSIPEDEICDYLRAALLNLLRGSTSKLAEEVNLSIIKGASIPADRAFVSHPDSEEFRIAVYNLEKSWPGQHRKTILAAVEQFFLPNAVVRVDNGGFSVAFDTIAKFQATEMIPVVNATLAVNCNRNNCAAIRFWMYNVTHKFPEAAKVKALRDLASLPVKDSALRDKMIAEEISYNACGLNSSEVREFVANVYQTKMNPEQRARFLKIGEQRGNPDSAFIQEIAKGGR